MLNVIKSHLPVILLSVAFLAYYLYQETSIYTGQYDAIHQAVHDQGVFHDIASSCDVTLKYRSGNSSNHTDQLYGSSVYYLIGSNANVALYMSKLNEHCSQLIESKSAWINGRGQTGSDADIIGFRRSYTRGSRSGFVDVRRVGMSKEAYHEEVKGEVYDLRVISYEHK